MHTFFLNGTITPCRVSTFWYAFIVCLCWLLLEWKWLNLGLSFVSLILFKCYLFSKRNYNEISKSKKIIYNLWIIWIWIKIIGNSTLLFKVLRSFFSFEFYKFWKIFCLVDYFKFSCGLIHHYYWVVNSMLTECFTLIALCQT